eukprot:5080945-Pyramimonas_sp.AAC.2
MNAFMHAYACMNEECMNDQTNACMNAFALRPLRVATEASKSVRQAASAKSGRRRVGHTPGPWRGARDAAGSAGSAGSAGFACSAAAA